MVPYITMGPNPSFDAGTTRRYGGDALEFDGYTLQEDTIYGDCHFADFVLKESSANQYADISGGGGDVSVRFHGFSGNQTTTFPATTPPIDWDITISLDTMANPVYPAYTVNYNHDCFPAHEAYVGTQRVYGYRPQRSNAVYIGYCLAGGSPVTGSTIGTIN